MIKNNYITHHNSTNGWQIGEIFQPLTSFVQMITGKEDAANNYARGQSCQKFNLNIKNMRTFYLVITFSWFLFDFINYKLYRYKVSKKNIHLFNNKRIFFGETPGWGKSCILSIMSNTSQSIQSIFPTL